MQQIELDQQEHIYTVSRLNNEVRFLLEDTYSSVWVEGEISNFAAPRSGHLYFSLKDSSAQVRCAMFRVNQKQLSFAPKDGSQVLVKARPSLYENRGEFQLIVEHIEERGEGKLRRAFEALKKKLEEQGLFDLGHKKLFPIYPKSIGVITSPTGAAIRDVLTVMKRRYPAASVVIYPTLVQGDAAASAIVHAIKKANARKECDVIILTRGGGSLEDLWPFNEEIVAHAIYNSELPIISGVGHEVDFTIADFVADRRAPTPSAAAEMITPDRFELLQLLARQRQQFIRNCLNKLTNQKQNLAWIQKHLTQQHPKHRLIHNMQRLDFCELSLIQFQTKLINDLNNQLKLLDFRLHKQIPSKYIQKRETELKLLHQKLLLEISAVIRNSKATLTNLAAKLHVLSPLTTLDRGFAIASKNGKLIHDANSLKIGDHINVRFRHGQAVCLIETLED